MKKTLGLTALALAAALALPATAQTVLKFSHTDQQAGARQAAAAVFAKKVEELTAGPLQGAGLLLQPARQRPEEHRAAGAGRHRLHGLGHRLLRAPRADLNLTMLPFLVEGYKQGWKLYDESKWLQEQFDKAPAKGFRFLATWEAGFRSMTTKGPLNSPDDAKGKKLRTFPNEMMRWTLEAMGFNIQIMPLPEVYLAIQQGAVLRPGEPGRHHLLEQVLRGGAQRHADQPRVQPDPAGHQREDLAEAVAAPTRRP
jgi:hypothetical protein